MNGKRTLVIVLVLVAFVGLGVLVSNSLKESKKTSPATPSQEETQEETTVSESTPEPNTASFRTSSTTWVLNKSYEVEISFSEDPKPYPTAFTLQILYDPEVLKVEEIEEGNLWTGTNVLERKIDNEKGQIMFSAGQGFEDKITNERLIAKIKVNVVNVDKENPETELRLGPESATASVGVNQLIPLTASSIKFNLSQ